MKMLLYPLFCLLCIPFVSMASDFDDWYKVKTDKNGNIYVLGEYTGKVSIDTFIFGDSTRPHGSYNASYFIVKISPTGAILWADSISRVMTNCGGQCPGHVGLAVDNESNILISLWSSDSIIYRGVYYYQPNIIKLGSNGNLIWTKQIRELGAKTDIGIDSKNNIYYASIFRNAIISDTVSLITCDSPSQKTFVAKISPNGSTKWIKEIASPVAGGASRCIQQCYFLATDSNGNSYVGGLAKGNISLGGSTFNCSGFYPFLAKLDSNGAAGFLKGYFSSWIRGTAHNYLRDGCVSAGQRLYTCGSFRDTVYVSGSNYVVTEPNIITPYVSEVNKLSGDALWYQYNKDIYSPLFWNKAFSVCADSLNNSFLIGNINDNIEFSTGPATSTLTPSLSKTYFAKFDSSGDFQCYQTDTSNLIDGATFGTNYYTVGISDEMTISGINRKSIAIVKWDINSCSQIWRIKFHHVVESPSIDAIESIDQNRNICLFPNPCTNGILYMKKDENIKVVSIHIYNLMGKEISITNNNELFLDISNQPKGIYIYKAVLEDNSVSIGKITYR